MASKAYFDWQRKLITVAALNAALLIVLGLMLKVCGYSPLWMFASLLILGPIYYTRLKWK